MPRVTYSSAKRVIAAPRPIAQNNQPIGLPGRRDATSAPTVALASVPPTNTGMSNQSSVSGWPVSGRIAAGSAITTVSPHTDQAIRRAVVVFIVSLPGSFR
jgi:hypothetical protein